MHNNYYDWKHYVKRRRTWGKYRGPSGRFEARSRLRNAMRVALRRRYNNKYRRLATVRLPLPNDLRRYVREFL